MKAVASLRGDEKESPQKKRAIVFGITDNLCFAVGTMLISFLKHNPSFDGTILIFHENLADDQMSTLNLIYPTISFRKLTREHVEKKFSKAANRQVIESLISRYSIFYFAKFELPDLLDEFERVIWFDVDMLVRGSLDEIWKFDEFTWRPVGPASKLRRQFLELFENDIKTKAYNRPNGGLIGICRDVRKRGEVTSARLYHWFNEIQTRGRSLIADEFSFFLLAATMDAKVKELAPSYNCNSTRRAADSAKVIHAVGAEKFWSHASMRLAYPDWLLWHNEWVSFGGDSYDGSISPAGLAIASPDQIIEASFYQGYWSDCFYDIVDRLPQGVIPDIQTHRFFWQFFVQSWPREQFHIEVYKYSRCFYVALHLEHELANDATLVKKVDKIFSNVDGFNKVPTKFGLSWEHEATEATVPDLIIECANLAIKVAKPAKASK